MQGDRHYDALAVVAIRGHEHRRVRQASMLLDLGHMLVEQYQAIEMERLSTMSYPTQKTLGKAPVPAMKNVECTNESRAVIIFMFQILLVFPGFY